MPKANPLHLCHLCGSHFAHLFAYNRHLLRQHWFEAQKDFSEEQLKNKVKPKSKSLWNLQITGIIGEPDKLKLE